MFSLIPIEKNLKCIGFEIHTIITNMKLSVNVYCILYYNDIMLVQCCTIEFMQAESSKFSTTGASWTRSLQSHVCPTVNNDSAYNNGMSLFVVISRRTICLKLAPQICFMYEVSFVYLYGNLIFMSYASL